MLIIHPCCHTGISKCVSIFLQITLFAWLAVVLAGMEVGSRLVVLRLLFKLFMISRFLAFSARAQKVIRSNRSQVKS